MIRPRRDLICLCPSIYKGSNPEKKAAFFWTLSKSGLDPPPSTRFGHPWGNFGLNRFRKNIQLKTISKLPKKNHINTSKQPKKLLEYIHRSSALSFCPQFQFFSSLSSVLIRFRIHIKTSINNSLQGKISIYGVHPRRALVLFYTDT